MPRRDIETDHGEIDSDSLCTPPLIFEPMYELWGGIPDCDPCWNPHALVRAKTQYPTGGLLFPWRLNTYENHPYSINEPWMAKAVYEMKLGHVTELLVLCMAAPSTAWWNGFMVKPKRNPRVNFTKRLKFYGPNGRPMPHGARFDTALIYYGSKVAKFDRLFRHVERWSTWGR
jgi:hypothetical protein